MIGQYRDLFSLFQCLLLRALGGFLTAFAIVIKTDDFLMVNLAR